MTVKSPYQRDYDAKLAELRNAPRFRKYIMELIEYDEALKIEPELTWKLFKKRKYNETYESKKKVNNQEPLG
jgi:hypothetical protein